MHGADEVCTILCGSVCAARPRSLTPILCLFLFLHLCSGSVYYVESTTHATSWDVPDGFAGSPAAEWVCHQDPDGSGHEYYVNETTQETSWELPAALA